MRKVFVRITWGIACLTALSFVATACGGASPTPTSPPSASPTAVAVTATPTPTPGALPTTVRAAPTATPAPSPTAAPASTSAPAESIKRGGILQTRLLSDPVPWDITLGLSGSYPPFLPVLSTLLQTDLPRRDIAGDLAETWALSPDGKDITFSLVKGVRWHDEKPLTASDIKSQLDKVFFGVGGRISNLKGLFTAAERVEVPDASTVKIVLQRRSNAFLANMSHGLMVNYAPHVPDEELNKGKVIGTGAFIWERWQPGARITLRANPHFFRRDPQGNKLPYLDGIEFNIIKEGATHMAAFRTGRLDLYDIADGGLVGEQELLKAAIPGLHIALKPARQYDMIMIRNAPPFTDIRLRQAMQFGLDRKLFVQAGVRNLGFASGFAMPGPHMEGTWGLLEAEEKTFPGNDPAKRAEDLAKARDLFKQAGFGPDNPLKLVMSILANDAVVIRGTAAAGGLREVGFQIELRPEEAAAHDRRLTRGGDFVLLYRGLASRLGDPADTLGTFWTTDAPRNYGLWSDPEVDRLYAEQETTTDPSRRRSLVQEALKRVYIGSHNIVVGWHSPPWAARPEVQGWPADISFNNPGRHETTWLDR